MTKKVTTLAEHRAAKSGLPPGYHVRWDPDLLTLHRGDGIMVAAFSNRAAAWTGLVRAAADDLHGTGQSMS